MERMTGVPSARSLCSLAQDKLIPPSLVHGSEYGRCIFSGADDGGRTRDLRHGKATL